MARISLMVRDKKTGRPRRKAAKAIRAGRKAARKRGHRPHSVAHRRAIAKALRKSFRTGKTKFGRKRLRPGRKAGFHHSKATRAKMSKSHRARHRR
jgi:NUMOD3 motif